jgi:hypothetical protein
LLAIGEGGHRHGQNWGRSVLSQFWSIAVAIPVQIARKVARDRVTFMRTLSRSYLDSNFESRYFVAVELGAKIRSINVTFVIIMQ